MNTKSLILLWLVMALSINNFQYTLFYLGVNSSSLRSVLEYIHKYIEDMKKLML